MFRGTAVGDKNIRKPQCKPLTLSSNVSLKWLMCGFGR